MGGEGGNMGMVGLLVDEGYILDYRMHLLLSLTQQLSMMGMKKLVRKSLPKYASSQHTNTLLSENIYQ